jgi:hypothetical protein
MLIFANPIISSYHISSLSIQLYVVPFPSLIGNDGDGSLLRPYSSLQQALDHIESEYYHDINSARKKIINLYPTHHFIDTVRFTQAHSHTRLTTMSIKDTVLYDEISAQERTHRRLSIAIISGGVPITGWTKVSGNTYSAVISQPVFINQLFVENRRVPRSRVPANYSDYLQYAVPLEDPNQTRYGFQYQPGQFDYKSLDDAMIVVYHSWTTSHHYIDQLITANNTILFTNPSDRPIGYYKYQANRRFHIENLCETLTSNSFCFINATKNVTLMTDGSYNPNKVQIITPVKEFVLIIAGEDVNRSVEDIIISNVAIQHSAWNIERTEQADQQAAAFLQSASLYIANATSIIISDVEVSHTGSYGMWIKEGTTNIDIMNSLVTDTGAGGIRIGQMITPVPTPTSSVKIISNEVSYGGNVFPSGVGVISQRASDIVIADNLIHHHRYTGVSVGWEWNYASSGTSNVLVANNYIYDIGRHILCDQGGIYTLGVQPGTVITNNVIKNVFSYSALMWGIYMDAGSSQIVVSNNIVYNTGWASIFQHHGVNNTAINNVFARASLISRPQLGVPMSDGDVHVGPSGNNTSLTYTRNIVYDTFQEANHSVVNCYLSNVTVSFNNNVYYNPYGTRLLFGTHVTSFSDWQKRGQDNDSVIADPLFVGSVNQCDFFTVRANSPAAVLGFVNITKLAKWTPGCGTDEGSNDNQFYHW